MENCMNRDGKCDPECESDEAIPIFGFVPDYDTGNQINGIQRLRNKKYNKGLAFTIEERKFLGIHGLLPAVVRTQEEMIKHCTGLLNGFSRFIDKFMFLMRVAERNERLFYSILRSNNLKFLQYIDTSNMGDISLKFGLVYEFPRGLYLNINHKGHIYDILGTWPEKHIRVVVFTDGARVLGLGDLGAYGIVITMSKSMIHTVLGGIRPEHCLTVVLDCGTNTSSVIIDPLYIGLREQRVRGKRYDEFLDEFFDAVTRRYGRKCLFHFEDFGNADAFRFLEKYRQNFCTYNNDIQVPGAVVLSGILVAMKELKTSLDSQTILFFGAGQCNIGSARMVQYTIMRNGVSADDAKKRIWMFDTKGLVVKNRPSGGLTDVKLAFAQDSEPIEDLLEAIEKIRPNILIGATAASGAFTPNVLRLMAKINPKPIIFALSNPANKSECTAKDAYTYTCGKCYFATGSPFPPFTYGNKPLLTGRCNNIQIFPGIALGATCSGMIRIHDEIFFIAAETLSDLIMSEEVAKGLLYPPISRGLCNSLEIARWVMEYAYRFNLATVYPEPEDKYEFITSQMYDTNFQEIIPEVYLKDEN